MNSFLVFIKFVGIIWIHFVTDIQFWINNVFKKCGTYYSCNSNGKPHVSIFWLWRDTLVIGLGLILLSIYSFEHWYTHLRD
jgi:hypothetical protein